jgi:hypothetical protein
MKLRNLLIAAVVLAALSGVLYWSNHRKPSEASSATPSPDTPARILSLNQSDISSLDILHKDQPAVDLSKDGSGNWQITAPKTLPADQDAVSSLISSASFLDSQRVVDDKPSDLAQYGLASPALELDIKLKDNKTDKLLIGDQTPAGDAYYTMVSGDPRLFTLSSSYKTNLDKSLGDLRDKRLVTADFDKVSQIELLTQTKDNKKQDITLARNKDNWQILKPGPYRAQNDQVEALISSLKEAKFDATAAPDDPKLAAAYNSAAPFASAKITGASGTQDLEIRKTKDKDDYYAKSSAVAGVFKVPATVGTGLNKSLDELRNKKLFDFGFEEPNKIEIHDGAAKAYYFTRSNSDWFGADGKKLDSDTVDSLLGNLRDLAAVSFVDSGFTAPQIEITVTSEDNKRVEKISISKSGENYIAKRESEPSLYQLTSASISDMEAAAAGVKPAAPPAPAPKK